MTITYSHKRGIIFANDRIIGASCQVRNELNKLRPRGIEKDVVYSINTDGSRGSPVMPRQFPVGEWTITKLVLKDGFDGKPVDPYLYPVFIATDAWQNLEVWTLDIHGHYLKPSGVIVQDYAYGLHYSTSLTTLGCIRIGTENEIRWLADHVKVGEKMVVEL